MASDKHLDLNEQISSLMDNHREDLEFDDRLDSLAISGEARDKWERYHLIRDVIQKDYHAPLSSDFASNVSALIQQEPAIVAFPAQGAAEMDSESSVEVKTNEVSEADSDSAASSANVTDFNEARDKASLNAASLNQGKTSNWRRNAGGLAVAASVAMVALVGMNVFQANQGNDAPLVADAGDQSGSSSGGASSEIIGGQPPVLVMENTGQIEFVSNTGTYWVAAGDNKLSPDNESRLNMYLSQHLEASPTAGVQGFLPYSRLAGYDSAAIREQAETGQ